MRKVAYLANLQTTFLAPLGWLVFRIKNFYINTVKSGENVFKVARNVTTCKIHNVHNFKWQNKNWTVT